MKSSRWMAGVLGIPKLTLESWVSLVAKSKLKGAGIKPVSAEQMKIAMLRAEVASFKNGARHLKKTTSYFSRESS